MNPHREQQIARARALRAQGVVLREIAERLGVSLSTAARWSDPAFAQRARERSRRAKQARRVPCERCRRPLSYERPGGLCAHCQREHSRQRLQQIARLYRAGHGPREIAPRVALSEGHVRNLIGQLARTGKLDARYPLRDSASVRGREQQILAMRAQRATHARAAEAVGLTRGSLNQALVRLRKRDQPPGRAAA